MKVYGFNVALALGAIIAIANAQGSTPVPPSPCQIRPTVFDGWQAQEVTNDWVRLTFVPQLGGRLMQVTFNGHPYLFGSAQESGETRDFRGVSVSSHWTAAAAVAVGMWEPAFFAGFQDPRALEEGRSLQ